MAGLAAETPQLSPAGAGMRPCGGTLRASLTPCRSGPWAQGLLVLAGPFRASPSPSTTLILAVPSWEITTLRRGRSWHPCPRLSSGELGSNLYLSPLLMRGCSGVEQLSWLFARQRSELPPVKATRTFSLPRSKKMPSPRPHGGKQEPDSSLDNLCMFLFSSFLSSLCVYMKKALKRHCSQT